MQSTFSGIEMGKRALVTHNQAMTTAGHNLSNASTEGYSRQRVEMKAFDPIYLPQLNREETAGQLGQGVSSQSINRIRDELLDQRIVANTNREGYWKTRDNYLLMLEQIYNEPAETSMRTRMDQFWDSWQELSVYPDQKAARQSVASRGQTLVDSVQQRFKSLDGIKTMLNGDIEGTVKQVNDLSRQIAAVSEEIVKSQAMGDNPNDLLDRRDLLVEKLSDLINITTGIQDSDEFVVYTDGHELVQGNKFRTFSMTSGAENGGYGQVIWNDTKDGAFFSGGKLGALVELRDFDIRSEIQNLDKMAMNFTDMVNDIHRAGTGANGRTNMDFFVEHPFVPNVDGNFDRSGNGEFDSTYLFRISGAQILEADAQVGLEGTLTLSAAEDTVQVPYYSTDRVADIIERINNSGAEVTANLDRSGRLVLKGTTAANSSRPDFVIRHVEDSGRFLNGYAGVLNGSGSDNAYTWDKPSAGNLLAKDALYTVAPTSHPSAWLAVNDAITTDIQTIAAGEADVSGRIESGDGTVASAIAAIRNTQVMIGDMQTFDDYFADSVATIGLKGEQAERISATTSTVMAELRNLRDSISGVNIDEELSDIIKFQHGYNAAAKFISTYNEMLDTVINRLGV